MNPQLEPYDSRVATSSVQRVVNRTHESQPFIFQTKRVHMDEIVLPRFEQKFNFFTTLKFFCAICINAIVFATQKRLPLPKKWEALAVATEMNQVHRALH